MSALEQIERQLLESVAARGHDDISQVLAPTSVRRLASPRAAWPLVRRRPAQLALAVLLAGALLLVGLTSLSDAPIVPAANAATRALERLAMISASGPSLIPGRGRYLLSRSQSDYHSYYNGDGCVASQLDGSQTWVAADGSGLARDLLAPPRFSSPADKTRCQAAEPSLDKTAGRSNVWFAAGCYEISPASNMRSLSTDPRRLLAQMHAIEGGPDTAAEDFVHVGDFLRETDAGPALRAALYRAAALIPGVRLLGVVHNHSGRSGLGVALTTADGTRELIFNPRTAALIGEQGTGSTPTSNYWAVYSSPRVVDDLPKTSPVALKPACVGGHGRVHDVSGGSVVTGVTG